MHRIVAYAEEGEIVGGKPFQELHRLGDLIDRHRRRIGLEAPPRRRRRGASIGLQSSPPAALRTAPMSSARAISCAPASSSIRSIGRGSSFRAASPSPRPSETSRMSAPIGRARPATTGCARRRTPMPRSVSSPITESTRNGMSSLMISTTDTALERVAGIARRRDHANSRGSGLRAPGGTPRRRGSAPRSPPACRAPGPRARRCRTEARRSPRARFQGRRLRSARERSVRRCCRSVPWCLTFESPLQCRPRDF